MERTSRRGVGLALLAAALYAVNIPFSKLLLPHMPAVLMAGVLYLGAGLAMLVLFLLRRLRHAPQQPALTRADLPYIVAMIVLDIAAPVCLMLGLQSTSAANASLLNNFEIVATALIALLFFHEKIGRRLGAGILLVTLACLLLSFENRTSLRFSSGSLLVLLAAACWGLENNCTRRLSDKDPLRIVLLKGIFSGLGSVLIGLCSGERGEWAYVPAVLLLGAVAYGMSIYFYVSAQRLLGAARTSAYYAAAPFIGTLLSLIIFQTLPPAAYYAALALMLTGAVLCS